jgi:hypothetical protein
MFHVKEFWYRLNEQETGEGIRFGDSILVWIHSESADEQNRVGVLRKMVKNIRWLAKKADCTSVVLHPFAHLDDDRARPEFADEVIEETASRLEDRDYQVQIVPFGHFTEFSLHAQGPSLAKVFKRFV